MFWRRELFYGETTFDYDWSLPPDGAEVALALSPDRDLAQATTLTCRRVGDTAHVVIAQQGQAVKALDVPLDHRLRCGLRREGSRLTFHCSGETLDAAPAAGGEGGAAGVPRGGILPRLAALTVWSANLQDTTFDTAPADWWIGSGTWDLTNRWSCVPEWSWYGGYSGQRAAIWSETGVCRRPGGGLLRRREDDGTRTRRATTGRMASGLATSTSRSAATAGTRTPATLS
ncbi:MAG: hypothetical protein M5U09_18155 [Gammaproteobacteria bacterium]|nr:hypothetical protein [Gammaproteobacteria bacterium]